VFLGLDDILSVQAIVGERARLPCQAEILKEVDWKYLNASYPARERVWNRKDIVNGYMNRFTIETQAVGSYNLIIFPAQLNDSGIYECIEDGGFGKIHLIRLTVKRGETMYLLLSLVSHRMVMLIYRLKFFVHHAVHAIDELWQQM